jgi:hypothetical protein
VRTGTKFWLAIVVVAIQTLIFAVMALKGTLTEGMLIAFLAAPVATFVGFGILNVAASGQATTTTTITSDPPATKTETKTPSGVTP